MRRPCLSVAFGLFAAFFALEAMAVAPSLTGITPYGFQRGKEVEVSFTGARLSDAQELMFYTPGFEVKELTAEKDNLVRAKLSVAADCELGIHAVRLRTATGISDLRTFTVGALPEVKEQEPNSDFAAPQVVEINSTVGGVVQAEDVDYYAVQAKKGDRITAELEGIRLGYTFFDPYLAILDSERFELARSDDVSLLRQDCLCAVVAPEDGTYLVQVRESAYGGNGNCKYRLHIGNFPRPLAVYPAGGQPGQLLDLTWIGDPAGDSQQQITLPSLEDPKFGLHAEDQFGIAPAPNRIRVVDLPNVLETEPNNAAAQATVGTAPCAFNGIISEPGDMDFFKFTAKKGQRFDIRVYARNPMRSPLDSVLVVRRSNGSSVGSNDDTGGPDSYYRFTAPADDEYQVQIYDHLRGGGPTFVYRIEVAPVARQLTMVLPETTRYVSKTLVVPRGNRMAMMVNATRANWGGELNVSVDGMPEGLSLQTVTMPANRTTVPTLFTAAEDAPVAGALADLIGKPVDEQIDVIGHLSQRTMLVRGQNNRDVWGHDADRMAVAATEAAPYSIEIMAPKSPIARRGSKGLKVVAKRQEGFKGAIAIRMLYNPPGIGSSGSISIPADKDQAEIPLTANTSAAIGAWPIVVVGSSTVGNGRVEVASQMVDLQIADSYVNLTFDKSAAELGQQTNFVVHIETKTDYDGEAEIRLLGLPANTSTDAEPKKISKDDSEVIFPITIAENAKPATYKSLVCRVVVTENGEPVTHTLGSGELRIDKPLPPKAAAPKTAAKPAATKPQPQAAPAKPLSRLEQLRQQKLQEAGEK